MTMLTQGMACESPIFVRRRKFEVPRALLSTYTGSGGRDLKGTKDKPKNVRDSCVLRHMMLFLTYY